MRRVEDFYLNVAHGFSLIQVQFNFISEVYWRANSAACLIILKSDQAENDRMLNISLHIHLFMYAASMNEYYIYIYMYIERVYFRLSLWFVRGLFFFVPVTLPGENRIYILI